jgi:predicted chitinase
MMEQVISKEHFIAQVKTELSGLLSSAKEEYTADLQALSLQFAEQYYQFLNGATETDRKRAEDNIRHIRAVMVHISARMGLDVAGRLISICTTVLTIAASAAVRAII